jgi:hypothetical protein
MSDNYDDVKKKLDALMEVVKGKMSTDPVFKEVSDIMAKLADSEFGREAMNQLEEHSLKRIMGNEPPKGFHAIAGRRGPTRREIVGLIRLMTMAEVAMALEKNGRDPIKAYDAMIDIAVELDAIRKEGETIEKSDVPAINKEEELAKKLADGAIFGQPAARA